LVTFGHHNRFSSEKRAKPVRWTDAAVIQLIAMALQKNPWATRGKHDVSAQAWQAVADHLLTNKLLEAVDGDKCRDKLTKLMKANIARRNAEASRTGAGAALPMIAPTADSQADLDRCTEVDSLSDNSILQ
jgi:hypothetical protein